MGVFAKKNKKLSSDNFRLIIQGTSAAKIAEAIECAMRLNSSIQFARTKDGKSVCVTLYDGEDNEKEYAADVTEFGEILDTIVIAAEDEDQPPPPPPTDSKPGKRTRST